MSSNFDPYKQSVIFYSSDGAPFEVPIKVVNDFYLYCFISCINFGAQFGASLIIFIVLLLLTRPEKRASSVFFLNCGALLVNIGRMLSQFIYFTSDYLQAYQYFASDSSRASTSTRANSILRVVLAFLLLVCIEISLVLQVQVVCANLRRRYRVVLLCVSILVALILFGFRMGLMIVNCKEIISPQSANPLLVWLESNTNIVVNISICFFCIIFIAKLGHAIHQRKILGMGCFGPMKVIFIMGCQTLVIPALVAILQYIVTVPALSTNVMTIVAIFPPLSSLWAGVTLTQTSTTGSSTSRRALWDRLTFSNILKSKQTSSPDINIASMSYPSHKSSTVYYAAQDSARKQHDMEQGHGISVEHDVSVHRYPRVQPRG